MSGVEENIKHVALFLPALHEGGAERVMVKLANAIAARGHRVDLVLATKTGPFLDEVSDEVTIVDLGCARIATAVLPLVKYLRKARPQSILATLTHANIVATVAAKLSRVPVKVLLREAGLPTLDPKQSLGKKPKGIMRIAQWVFPFADHIIGVSKGVKNELVEFLKIEHRVEHSVIYNPVISEQLYELSGQAMERAHEAFFTKPVVLGIGRLSPEKDFATLIEAFSIVRKKVDCHLLILGSGALEPELRERVTALGVDDHVFMPGFVGNPYPFLKRCSVYVLSSVSEGLPNALIEALALGVPVVSTEIANGPAEILDDGKWGALVPIGDHTVLAQAVSASLLSPPEPIPETEEWWVRFAESSIIDQYLQKML